MAPEQSLESAGLLLNEAKLLLAEKRTQLAGIRTGLAVLVVPLSVITFLVATSRYYHADENVWFLIPLVGLCTLLIALGSYLIARAVIRLRHADHMLRQLKGGDACLDWLVDGQEGKVGPGL